MDLPDQSQIQEERFRRLQARLRERLGAEAALVVPLLFRGHAVGVLVALDREAGGTDFDEEDSRTLSCLPRQPPSARRFRR